MKIIRHNPEKSMVSGSYSPAVEIVHNDFREIYISGQGTKNPETGERFLGEIKEQTRLAMNNLKLVIEGSGYEMNQIVKTTLFLLNMDSFKEVDSVYQTYFSKGQFPARSTVAVKDLPGGQSIEIEAIAVKAED